ncbi:MAG: type IV secretion system protein [Comamonadaceae bacterium]|jgi:type IV secretion system protein VirB6|nr:type IV secretion system protein [Comamonadaceae bacterium]
MFTWVGSQFDSVLNTYVVGVVSSLIAGITPIAITCMTLWIALYGWAVIRHEVSETVPAFIWKVFKIGLVLAVALQSGFYISTVSDTANALATGVATTFQPATADPTTIAGPYALLDKFNDNASQLVIDLLKEGGWTRPELWFAAAVTAIGNVVFLCLALYVVTLAKVFLTFTIAVGPLFVLCLAWRPTAKFFDSWLSMLLNAVVLTWIAFFALGLSAHLGQTIVQTIQDQGGFAGPTFNAVGESMKYCIVMVLMAILCFQAPSLAAALTGGPAIQQGVQMVQNAMMVAGLRSSSRAAGTTPGGSGGGTVRAGVGLPYIAGQATGAAASAAGRMARHGAGAVRTAAYKLAALRGRT